MANKKRFWIGFSLLNLSVLAAFGALLRSKILFPIPAIDFKNLLSAHSHFAFGGWAGLCLSALLIYELLPEESSSRRIYQWILWGTLICSYGMAFTFPFTGYAFGSIVFSTAYIFVSYLFAFVFTRDVLRFVRNKSILWLSITAIFCMVISSIGPFGLAYEMSTKSSWIISFRDLIYTFLHFQYNGFFTLAVLSLFINRFLQKQKEVPKHALWFSISLCVSVPPSLFLALLWHNSELLYVIAGIGAILILAGLYFFLKVWKEAGNQGLYSFKSARGLFILSFISLSLKMLLQVGTIFPDLGNAVYGDRPLIIGFLHLVFLGFMTLYLLSFFIESGYFTRNGKVIVYPIMIFTSGVIANEVLLMFQGLGILLNTNSDLYKWMLWVTSIILLTGAILITSVQLRKSD